MLGNENTIRSLRTILVAVGDDGRKRTTHCLLLAISLVLVGGHSASADYMFGPPTNLGPRVNWSAGDFGPCPSADGLSLFFTSGRSGGYDLFVITRPTVNEDWSSPQTLGPTVNSSAADWGPCISADGLEFYFTSNRPGGSGDGDLWVTKRATTEHPWGTPVNVGATVNSPFLDWTPSISADGLSLFFNSNRLEGCGREDLYVTSRATTDAPWGAPVNLGPTINSTDFDARPHISADGLTLFFCSNRPGGYGDYDLYMARRATTDADWGSPVNLGPMVNSTADEAGGKTSADGSVLYFQSNRPGGVGGFDLWQAAILPIVDFNGDKKVDLVDLVMLIDDWGTNNKTLCDIGPMPWGDGKVDIEDLKVFMTYYEKENPPVQR